MIDNRVTFYRCETIQNGSLMITKTKVEISVNLFQNKFSRICNIQCYFWQFKNWLFPVTYASYISFSITAMILLYPLTILSFNLNNISISFPDSKIQPEAMFFFKHQYNLMKIVFLCQDSMLFYFSLHDPSQRKATVGGPSEQQRNNYSQVLPWQGRVARVERERERERVTWKSHMRKIRRYNRAPEEAVALKRRPASDVFVSW